MDSSAQGIFFDSFGICNFCSAYQVQTKKTSQIVNDGKALDKFLESIKKEGTKTDYDCIVGVSGGVDSSWVLVNAVKLGLRPLAVHLDNGWNSELAQQNIENLIKKCKVDLITNVIDWNEFRDFQIALLNSNICDLEILTDNLLVAENYRQAKKRRTTNILSGSNTATEGIPMPENWAASCKFNKTALSNIWRIHGKKYNLKSIKPFSLSDYYRHVYIHRIKWVRFLDIIGYNKTKALQVLQQEFQYVPYAHKHYESIFTKIYQSVILPLKFGVDKRKNHFSALIMNGEMTRDTALSMLKKPAYESEEIKEESIKYFLKKINWTSDQFEFYLSKPETKIKYYGQDINIIKFIKDFLK
jgi:N-acetyl sugar amidotransferase